MKRCSTSLIIVILYSLSCVLFSPTSWTVACQASPIMGFPGQEYLSGLPFLSPVGCHFLLTTSQKNTNPNYNEVLPHISQNYHQQKNLQTMLEMMWKKGNLHCCWKCKFIQSLWRTVWRFLKQLKTELPQVPAIPILSIYLQNTIIRKDICTLMFIVALFTIAQIWRQAKGPLTED